MNHSRLRQMYRCIDVSPSAGSPAVDDSMVLTGIESNRASFTRASLMSRKLCIQCSLWLDLFFSTSQPILQTIVVVKMFSQLHQALTLKAASRKSKSRSPYREIDDHDEELIEACKSNYRNLQRRASTFADHHKEIIMNANIQPPPSKEVNSRNRDTGFPEPLSNGTSTKPQVDG
jgi:hypothetical protein